MARQINDIYQSLTEAFVFYAGEVGFSVDPSKWKKTDYKRLTLFAVAVGIGILEQLFDSFKSDTEDTLKVLSPQTKPWFRDRMINLFEFNSTTVPIVQLDTSLDPLTGVARLTPFYPSPNASNRIIKYCSVVSGSFGNTVIKVAAQSNGVPIKLTPSQLSTAASFIAIISDPGMNYSVVSLDSDKLFLQLDVYYNGNYSAVIEQRVTDAIKNYLRSIPFDGVIKLSNLVDAIKEVEGVGYDGDVVLVNVQARPDSVSVGLGTDLIKDNLEILREWPTVAGYIIPETSSGFLLSDNRTGTTIKNLNLIPQ